MLIACDKNSKRIEANNADKNEKYYCPKCGAEVLLKKGKLIGYTLQRVFGQELEKHKVANRTVYNLDWIY